MFCESRMSLHIPGTSAQMQKSCNKHYTIFFTHCKYIFAYFVHGNVTIFCPRTRHNCAGRYTFCPFLTSHALFRGERRFFLHERRLCAIIKVVLSPQQEDAKPSDKDFTYRGYSPRQSVFLTRQTAGGDQAERIESRFHVDDDIRENVRRGYASHSGRPL